MDYFKRYWSLFLFGTCLAVLLVILQFFEYRYLIGNLNTSVYTSVVATVFTLVGVWIGYNLLRKIKHHPIPKADGKVGNMVLKELQLNSREYEILELIARGHTNQEIADQLYLALPTIKTHVSNLYAKLGVQSRTQAIYKARNLKLI